MSFKGKGSQVVPEDASRAGSMMPLQGERPDIMDKYLKETSYYRQTMLSLTTAIESVWRKQAYANGAYETREKLKSFWTNIALVSALLIGVSYSSATNPVSSDDPDMQDAVSVTSVFSGVSLVFSLMTIVVSVIYMIEIDNATTERDLRDFIYANAPFVDMLTGVFSGSVVCLFLSAVSSMYITYGRDEWLVVATVAGSFTVAGSVFAAIVAGHNRFRLWVRYSSPEGLEQIAKVKADEIRELEELKRELLFQVRDLRELKELQELKEVKDKLGYKV